MIRMAVVGLADPRHRHLLAPVVRRRAGVRVVGVSDPAPQAREAWLQRHGDHTCPVVGDHTELLATVRPTLVAVTALTDVTDTAAVAAEALGSGADVLAVPPYAGSLDEWAALRTAARAAGRRITPLHTHRGHRASALVRELVDSATLGVVRQVTVVLAGDADPATRQEAIVEGVDLFGWLTGCHAGRVSAGPGAAPEDLTLGDLTMEGQGVSGPVRFEVCRAPDEARAPVGIQVQADHGLVEWEVASGLFHSALDGRRPVVLAPGAPGPDVADWVLDNLVRRRPGPVISGPAALAATGVLLAADESRRTGRPVDTTVGPAPGAVSPPPRA